MDQKELVLKVDNVKKKYRLGVIGGGTLQGDLQSWWARIRGKEDPNSKIGDDPTAKNGSFMALKGISFEVKKGERLGIIGGNGAGKSTTLKILSRVTAPTEGTVYIRGRISSMLEVGTGFHPELTGRENIYLTGAILGMSRHEVDQKMEDIIEFSECRQFIDTPVKRYSSGMYVKLAFSVAAHLDSEILIMDEVLAVGDMKFQQKCLKKMREVADNEGRTVLYVSHNMNTIRQLCDRCLVLEKGKIIYDGDVENGISLYMGNKSANQIYYTYDHYERERVADQKIQISSLKLLHLKEPVIYNSEVQVKIDYHSDEDYHGAAFRCIIFSKDNEPVGMSCTLPCLEIRQGMNSVVLQLHLPGLANGDYSARIVFYEVDEFGNDVVHEVIQGAFSFTIVNHNIDNNTTKVWKSNYWGHFNFPDIDIVSDV